MKLLVNKTKAILSGFAALFMGGFGMYYLLHKMYPEAPVFLCIGILFGYLFICNASVISITPEKISRSFLKIGKKEILWTDVKELGLIGENVFSHKKKNTGHKYLYFSPYPMTKEERFQTIVKWPPKNMLYAEYSEKILEYAMTIWNKELKTYNVEDLFPDTEDPK